jgi:inner membrane protein involved in colicin E2 resistance
MKTFYRLFAILGIAWAVLIHPFLFLQAIGDQQTRKIEALEAVTRSWMGPNRVTNGMVSISEDYARTYVQRTHEIAEAHNRRSVTYWVISWVSSAVIITLSICALLKAGKKDEHHAAS